VYFTFHSNTLTKLQTQLVKQLRVKINSLEWQHLGFTRDPNLNPNALKYNI